MALRLGGLIIKFSKSLNFLKNISRRSGHPSTTSREHQEDNENDQPARPQDRAPQASAAEAELLWEETGTVEHTPTGGIRAPWRQVNQRRIPLRPDCRQQGYDQRRPTHLPLHRRPAARGVGGADPAAPAAGDEARGGAGHGTTVLPPKPNGDMRRGQDRGGEGIEAADQAATIGPHRDGASCAPRFPDQRLHRRGRLTGGVGLPPCHG